MVSNSYTMPYFIIFHSACAVSLMDNMNITTSLVLMPANKCIFQTYYLLSMPIKQFDTFPTLRTERLILREIRESDVAEIFAIRSHEINLKYTGRQPPVSEEEALAHIHKLLTGTNNNEMLSWTVTEKDKDVAMGLIGFWNYHKSKPEVEIGYELHPDFVGKGFMSEAARTIFDFGLSEMGIETILAHVHKDNIRSINLLKRFEFVRDMAFYDEEDPDMKLWGLRGERREKREEK